MALRLLEIIIPEEHVAEVLTIIEEAQITNFWQTCNCESRAIYKLILAAESTEKIIDELERLYGKSSEFHMVLLPVEGSFPSPKEIEEKRAAVNQAGKQKKQPGMPLLSGLPSCFSSFISCLFPQTDLAGD